MTFKKTSFSTALELWITLYIRMQYVSSNRRQMCLSYIISFSSAPTLQCDIHKTSTDSNQYVQQHIVHGRTMAQAVSRRPLTAEFRVRGRVSACGGQNGTGTSFSQCFWFPLSLAFHCALHTHISRRGWTEGPLVTAVQRQSTDMNSNNIFYINMSILNVHNSFELT
jgi:hypothetical protein